MSIKKRAARIGLVLAVIALSAGILSGCGTIMSRSGKDCFGAPLMSGISWDTNYIAETGDNTEPIVYVMLPVDLILDVVLSPIDLVYMICGFEKKALNHRWN